MHAQFFKFQLAFTFLGLGLWGCGCRFGSHCLSGAPRHIVHIDHGINSQQQVGAGDANDVKQTEEHQANLLRMHECSNEVSADKGEDEDAAWSHDGFVLHYVDWWRIKRWKMRLRGQKHLYKQAFLTVRFVSNIPIRIIVAIIIRKAYKMLMTAAITI